MIKWAAGQCLVLRPCLGLSLEWPLSIWQNLSKNYKLAFLLKVANILQQFIIGVKFFQVDSQTSIFNVWLLLIRWAGRTCLYCGLYNSTASLLLSSPLPPSSWERESSADSPLSSLQQRHYFYPAMEFFTQAAATAATAAAGPVLSMQGCVCPSEI